MASNRHLGRIVALQCLYEFDFRSDMNDADVDMDEILERNIEQYQKAIDDKKFVIELTKSVHDSADELDGIIGPVAPEWPIDQIARMDKTILRIAAYELLKSKATPPKVVINEAVELAKSFGGDNSSKFINGVLGTLFRTHIEKGTSDEQSEKPAQKE